VESLGRVEDIHHAPHIIRSAAELKAHVVESDPFERGPRALLNFGHTVGHAVEAASGYRLSHGGSISAGMVAEAWLAERLGIADSELLPRLVETLDRFNLPLRVPGLDADAAWDAMTIDKKRLAGALRFALPESPGRGTVVEVSRDDSRAALDYAIGTGS
jgi:3-dehydroquinate synthetase